mmetsp:Transcript_8581/g.12829  ORF Transcript_8581/g.12829 Transcript_8581/m.12829 type:complete len:234 (-) Transcript_8581:373-1074(-)
MSSYDSVQIQKVEIDDAKGLEFWSQNFDEKLAVPTSEFYKPMLKKFSKENQKVVNVLCKHIICCAGDSNKKDVSCVDFDKFLKRFGPFEECIRNSKKVFFTETKRTDGGLEYTLVPWYHGYLDDCKKKIVDNPDKFLVREPSKKTVWNLLTVEYSKTIKKDGKTLLARNKKYLEINRKKRLFVWYSRDGKKQGHPKIEVALREMTKKRPPIVSDMWTQVEDQSLYQAASFDDE